MSWDDTRVRVEFGLGMAVVEETVDGLRRFNMKPVETADVWPMPEGKAQRGKPAITLQGATRPELLRQLADWMEQNDDVSLEELVLARGAAVQS